MNTLNKTLTVTALLALTAPLATQAMAEGSYVLGQVGYSVPASDSEAYGNNIAVDNTFKNDFENDDSFTGAIGVGYEFDNNLRIESRLANRTHDIDSTNYGTGERNGAEYTLDGEFQSTTLTLEGFYDIPTGFAVQPYVKAGVGVAYNDYEARLGGAGVSAYDAYDGKADGYYDAYADDDNTEFTWNVGLGASYAVSSRATIYGEYQYANFGDVATGQDSFTDGFKIDDASAHEVNLGLRYQF